jgi:glycosyltransferase involved in cell wall biosynthesis
MYFYEDVNFHLLNTKGITLHRIDAGSFYDPRNIIKAGKVLKRIKPDVIFSWLHACDVYSYFVRKFVPTCKWIMAERDSQYPTDLRFIVRRVLGQSADMIVCNSRKGKEYWLSNGMNESQLNVVINILTPPCMSKPPEIKATPLVLYAGRLEPQKNVLHTVRVFCSLSVKFPHGMFALVGDGSLRDEANEIIIRAGRADDVELIPFTKNIGDYFQSADVFVNLSKHEGMPNTVIENISLGNVVVVSNIPEHRDILGPDYPYYVDDSASVDKAVEVIEMGLAESNSSKILKYATQQLEEMTPSKVATNYISIFQQVIND